MHPGICFCSALNPGSAAGKGGSGEPQKDSESIGAVGHGDCCFVCMFVLLPKDHKISQEISQVSNLVKSQMNACQVASRLHASSLKLTSWKWLVMFVTA